MKITVLGGDGYCGWARRADARLHRHPGYGRVHELGCLNPAAPGLDSLMNIAVQYRERVDTSLFMPRVDWRRTRNDRRGPAVD